MCKDRAKYTDIHTFKGGNIVATSLKAFTCPKNLYSI